MRKKILILISNLESGGVSKSVASLLNAMDCEKYDVTLWMASPHGVFMPLIPPNVKVISDERIVALMQRLAGVRWLLRHWHIGLAFGSILRMVLSKVNKAWAGRLLAKLMPRIGEDCYDLIVDYNGQHQLYYMIDKLQGKKKVTFFHSDYKKWSHYLSADREYFPRADAIFTISNQCVASLKEVFPEVADKIFLFENISSPKLISTLAEEFEPEQFKGGNCLKFVSIGHVCRTKGSYLAVETAKLLKERGVDFRWVFVGKIAEPEVVELAKTNGLEKEMLFVGIQPNPYPYMRCADFFVHLSQFEGKSIALDEAKILCKPVVVTNFSTVTDQFTDRENASICRMEANDVVEKIMELASDKALQERYIRNLRENMHDNSSEVNKLYELLE